MSSSGTVISLGNCSSAKVAIPLNYSSAKPKLTSSKKAKSFSAIVIGYESYFGVKAITFSAVALVCAYPTPTAGTGLQRHLLNAVSSDKVARKYPLGHFPYCLYVEITTHHWHRDK